MSSKYEFRENQLNEFLSVGLDLDEIRCKKSVPKAELQGRPYFSHGRKRKYISKQTSQST